MELEHGVVQQGDNGLLESVIIGFKSSLLAPHSVIISQILLNFLKPIMCTKNGKNVFIT